MSTIINKIAQSGLITIDLEEWLPKEKKVLLDIKVWLEEGFILREKNFKEALKNHNWEQYKDHYVALYCSSEAILPTWAYWLISIYLNPYAKKTLKGSLETLTYFLYKKAIEEKDFSIFKEKRILITGCHKKKLDDSLYFLLIKKLLPLARSILYGEACSNIVLYKKKPSAHS